MRKAARGNQFQAPLMSAFRESFSNRDAKKRVINVIDGEKVLPGRRQQRGSDEVALKRDLTVDLIALLNTTDLGSSIDLDEFKFVRQSILNFGLYDIAHLTSEEFGVDAVKDDLHAALMAFEPRLNPETLHIERGESPDDVNQKVRFSVSAEMLCAPVDVPIDFVAEIEVSSGKVQLTRLPITV